MIVNDENSIVQVPNQSENQEKVNGDGSKRENGGSLSWQTPQITIPCIMFTGLDPIETAQFQRDTVSLGGLVAKQPSQATHLIVDDKIERTAKLLKCISTCSHILNKRWLIDSKAEGKFKDPLDTTNTFSYQASDPVFEKRYNCSSLRESLQRARENCNRLLFSVPVNFEEFMKFIFNFYSIPFFFFACVYVYMCVCVCVCVCVF